MMRDNWRGHGARLVGPGVTECAPASPHSVIADTAAASSASESTDTEAKSLQELAPAPIPVGRPPERPVPVHQAG
jgi:hypothetical protein